MTPIPFTSAKGVGGLLTLRAGLNKIIKYMEKFRLYEKMARENKRGS